MRSALLTLTLVLLLAGSASAADLHVSVGGTGEGCTVASPCSLSTALGRAQTGDFVRLGAGTYDGLAPLDVSKANLFGDPAAGRPLLRFTGDGLTLSTRIGGVDIEAAGAALTLKDSGEADGVLARTTGAGSAACTMDYGELADSACLAPDGVGLVRTGAQDSDGGRIRFVTARGKAAGVRVLPGPVAPSTAIANSIARAAGGTDLEVAAAGSGDKAAELTIEKTNYATGPAAPAGEQQTAAPAFLGDGYHQAPGSPTIDVLPATSVIAYDIDGDERTDHPADLGADEYYAPKATTFPPVTTATSATLQGSFETHGQGGVAAFEWGPTTAYGNTLQVGPVTGDVQTGKLLGGLSPSTTYHYRSILSVFGTTYTGNDVEFETEAVPDTTPPSVRIAVKGKRRRGRKVLVIVRASDASGIQQILIRVGSRPAVIASRLRVRLARRRTTITAIVKDRAGRVTRARKIIKAR